MSAAALETAVREARQAGRPRPAPADGGVSLAEAYGIQAARFGPAAPCGYKLGLVSPAKQEQMRIAHPIFGRVAAGMLLGERVDLGRFVQPRVEPELAVVLGAALAPGARRGAVARAVGAVFLAVDVLDSVWADYRFSLAQVVADNTSGGGFLLGERPLPFLPDGELRLLLDGETIARGPLSALGDVEAHLAWLAGQVGGLTAGAVVFLGSPAAAAPARAGLLELHGPHGSVLLARLEGAPGGD